MPSPFAEAASSLPALSGVALLIKVSLNVWAGELIRHSSFGVSKGTATVTADLFL